MQDRICQVDETSCNARPDHTFGSFASFWERPVVEGTSGHTADIRSKSPGDDGVPAFMDSSPSALIGRRHFCPIYIAHKNDPRTKSAVFPQLSGENVPPLKLTMLTRWLVVLRR